MAKTKYTISVRLEHTWTSIEEIDVVVVAEDPSEAKFMAADLAQDESAPDSFDADLDSTRVRSTSIESETPDYQDEPWFIPRCPDTPDMFTSQGL